MTKLHAPIITCTLIDLINRRAAATGSVRTAALTSNADYNGHFVCVYWNEYRKYYVADYTWAGRQVIARGSLDVCVAAAMREYRRGAKGAQVSISHLPSDSFDRALYPELVDGEEPKTPSPWQSHLIETALRNGTTGLLIEASSEEDYFARVRALRAGLRSA